jgi:transposase
MRHVGIDVGSQSHVVASIDDFGRVLLKPTSFDEDAEGYARLFSLLGPNQDTVIALESTGHYGQNLVATLRERGFHVAMINPLRSKRFAQEDLHRAKTDSVDALLLARFAAQKRLSFLDHRDVDTEELRELVHFHERLTQDLGDRLRQLHRLVDLCFPELPRHISLKRARALTVLRAYPTAQALAAASVEHLATLRGSRYRVGIDLARALVHAASRTVGRHQSPVYRAEIEHTCDDIATLRGRIHAIEEDLARRVSEHPIAALITTIDGLGVLAAAQVVATVGDPARFRSAAAFAAYIGVVPGTQHSGLHRPGQAPLSPIGNSRLRSALWMPTVCAAAAGHNPWLATYYRRLTGAGKPPKLALVAAMRKLVTAIYSVAKSRQPFIPRTK